MQYSQSSWQWPAEEQKTTVSQVVFRLDTSASPGFLPSVRASSGPDGIAAAAARRAAGARASADLRERRGHDHESARPVVRLDPEPHVAPGVVEGEPLLVAEERDER